MKASVEGALMIGWQAERFARTKDIKTPEDWLKLTKPRTTQEERDAESRALMRMFDRAIAKQGDQDGTR